MATPDLLFLRDLADVEPPRDRYKCYDDEDIYKLVPKPQWTGLEDEIWTPRANENDPQLERVKALMKRNAAGATEDPVDEAKADADDGPKGTAEDIKNTTMTVLNHKTMDVMMLVATFWALFSEDARVTAFERPGSIAGDISFRAISFAVMCIFFIDLVLRSWAQQKYLYSFFFWLDLISVLSMIMDVMPLFQTGGNDGGSLANQGSLARAGRAARAGTKIGRLLRLLRMVRVLKLFFMSKKKGAESEAQKEYTPSELGKELKARISQKTILFILVLLLGSTLLTLPFNDVINNSAIIGVGQVYLAGVNSTTTDPVFVKTLEAFHGTFKINLPFIMWTNTLLRLELKYNNDRSDGQINTEMKHLLMFNKGNDLMQYPEYSACDMDAFEKTEVGDECPYDIRHLRFGEMEFMKIYSAPFDSEKEKDGGSVNEKAVVWYSIRPYVLVDSYFSIFLTICIAVLLGVMAWLFSRDADTMVIRPIESMVDSVTKLAANPAYRLEQKKEVKYETDQLYVSLSKIAKLLQVGFGEAGNNLVAENLKKGDTVDPMVPGKKLLGAYGFCIIDDYEEVLECLAEEILPFTNTAAHIVHDAVTSNGGQPNRNLGEAFLCVWKPKIAECLEITPTQRRDADTKMCDGALTAFRTCVRNVTSSGKLQAYNNHEEIIKYFDGGYKTVIGYGLHYGWAIEGAVGTNIKIDCSYLSPNVNLAARLESATKMYGVNILMSEMFASKLSDATKIGMRRVDVVCLKGSSIPMAIFTCDRSNALYCSTAASERHGNDNVVPEFQRVFDLGMDNFVKGDWGVAKASFEAALAICPLDKPSKRIMMHMDTPDNHPDYGLATDSMVAPEGWPGYHILQSK